MRYLPDFPVFPEFQHIAVVPWPVDPRHNQQDWVNAVDTLEVWLESYIGCHYVNWVYHQVDYQEYWQACIAFRKDPDRTMFLLKWAN
jgi:hypothetical protein